MKAAGIHRPPLWGKLASAAIIAIAIGLGIYVAHRHASMPSTDDASIDADIVHVASVVGGRITEIGVAENASVAKGDLLFQIDPEPYRLVLTQAQAELAFAKATLETQRRVLSTQRSTAVVAGDQTRRAATNLEHANRTVDRLRPLAAKGYVPDQQLDQAQTAQRDAATSLRQAQEQQAAAGRAVDTDAAAEAAVHAREAALSIARRALEDTTVRAPHSGRVVGLTVSAGEIVAPSQSLFTLINTEEWFAVANFRENDLSAIAEGDCATVYSMLDRRQPIKGVVQGIGYGVLDSGRINLPRSLPFVERSLNWVKVAQRFPVRVRLEEPPARLVRLGATAAVEVQHGRACK
ncbi:multidrug transporter subunit MdtN [Variovorax sp. dw_954]|uniref:multidrug transporter subunit MdtN n=1 Tax=Variovorax sp. dw_954 TaxID=2720078 RepID=UPI001BD4A2EE|nr:multidrug transporter subunit MdtN [Variovorax sp. dw_954]